MTLLNLCKSYSIQYLMLVYEPACSDLDIFNVQIIVEQNQMD